MSDLLTNDLQFAPIDTLINPVDTPLNSAGEQSQGTFNYEISASTTGSPSSIDPGSDLGGAFNLGNPAAATVVYSNSVSAFDTIDTFKFTLGDNRNLNLSLTGLSNNADIKLLDSAGLEIASSNNIGTLDDFINLGGRPAGTYFAQVTSVNGVSTNYTLGVSTNDRTNASSNNRASNLLPIENEVGNLNGSVSFSGINLGNNDTSDVIHFSVLGVNKTLQVLLDGLSADADIRIIQDKNSNRVFDSADNLVASGINGGALPEQFNVTLPNSGDYFAQIYQFSGETNYNLTLTVV